MSIHDWAKHGDTNVGSGMVPDRRKTDRFSYTTDSAIKSLTEERDRLRARVAELEPYAEEMKWVQKVLGRAFDGDETGGAKAVETLMEQRDKARADERKACARVCVEAHREGHTAEWAAAAIRARSD